MQARRGFAASRLRMYKCICWTVVWIVRRVDARSGLKGYFSGVFYFACSMMDVCICGRDLI